MLSVLYTLRSQVTRCRMAPRVVDLTRHGAKRQASKPGHPGLHRPTAQRATGKRHRQAAKQETLKCRARCRPTTGHAPICW